LAAAYVLNRTRMATRLPLLASQRGLWHLVVAVHDSNIVHGCDQHPGWMRLRRMPRLSFIHFTQALLPWQRYERVWPGLSVNVDACAAGRTVRASATQTGNVAMASRLINFFFTVVG
jgi:hypothetical protein